MPNEIAIADPNRINSPALPRATQTRQIPKIKAMPKKNSAMVALQARNGIVEGGMKELTFAVYRTNPAKSPYPTFRPRYSPKRSAIPERNAAPSATRANRAAQDSQSGRPGLFLLSLASMHRRFR